MSHDGIIARLVAVFAAPRRAMEGVRDRPRWLIPGIVIALIVGVFSALTAHISGPEYMDLMRDSRLMDAMEPEEWEQQYAEAENPDTLKKATSAFTAGVGILFVLLMQGLLLLLFSKLAGGEAGFKQVMGVHFWAAMIGSGLGYVLRLPLVLAKQTVMGVSIGLAALLPRAPLDSPAYQALYFFGDFMVWWGLAVAAIGLVVINEWTAGRAAVVVVLPWLLFTGFMYGLQRLFI
jgi:hypothetical protein